MGGTGSGRKPEPKLPIPKQPDFFLPNHSGDLSAGDVLKTPVNENDPVNKKYVDDQFPVTHASTTGKTSDDHHAQVHTILSHDTDTTGAELTSLADSSDADALHTHTGANLTDDIFVKIAGDTMTGVLFLDSIGTGLDVLHSAEIGNHLIVGDNLTVDTNTLFVDSTIKRVGIGTTSPDTKLHVSSTGAADTLLTVGNAQSSILSFHNLTGTLFGTSTNNNLGFLTNNTEKMTILPNGNVGIGITVPDSKLEVNGNVHIDGDLFFETTGSGLPYGEIYARDNTATTSTSTTKTQVLIFDTNGLSNAMTPDHAQDHITVVKAGIYKIDTSISIKNSSGSAHVISVEMYKNNGTAVFNNIHAGRNLGTGSDVGNLTMSGLVDLAVNDTIEIWITSDSASARTVTVEDINFSAIHIGGT